MANKIESTEEMKSFWKKIEHQAKRALLNINCAHFDDIDITAAHSAAVTHLSEQVNHKAQELKGVEQL